MTAVPPRNFPRSTAALFGVLIAVGTGSASAADAPSASPAAPPAVASPTVTLFEEIAALDTAVFDAFNNCGVPAYLQLHAGYFAPAVEFYHDTGGVTWTREAMLANTAKYACGNYRRELVVGSLKVYPIKDFGAIAQGVHRFCPIKTGVCEGLADFVIVWQHHGGQWEITRVLSFGHRANDQPETTPHG